MSIAVVYERNWNVTIANINLPYSLERLLQMSQCVIPEFSKYLEAQCH